MVFSSMNFVIFFALVLVGLGVLRGRNEGRKLLLLAASWYFYACWDWRFLSLILISTFVDFWVGSRLGVTSSPSMRRRLLIGSLVVNLGLLGVFKYLNFFIDSIAPVVAGIGWHPGTLNIILPVGISFYTFQTLSYTIDVYKGRLAPHDSLLDFALFVGFFPQLVAGPIVRASHFLPQLKEYKRLTLLNFHRGGQLFVFGLFKKVFLADRLAQYSDVVFAGAGLYDTTTTWLAALAYSLQIYFDFSGYSDMAIGVALVLGYDLGENFNFPYLSKTLSEFWRRWHISLSTWIRDYIYFPLGGSRCSQLRNHVNLAVTWLLCGLWHGAAWTFVAWGALHGAGLAANRVLLGKKEVTGWMAGVCWLLTMVFVVSGWVLFRAESFHKAVLMLRQMFFPEPGIAWYSPVVPLILAGCAVVHAIESRGWWRRGFLPKGPHWYTPAMLFSLIGLVVTFYPEGFRPFIYFQF